MVIHSEHVECLDYAVNVLKVKHVIVWTLWMWWCQSRWEINRLIDNWIRHIKDVYRLHEHYLNTFEDEEEFQ
jgi:carbonic anhydrase